MPRVALALLIGHNDTVSKTSAAIRFCQPITTRVRIVPLCVGAGACLLLAFAAGCYVQQPLPHDPGYRPASWEPVLGVVMNGGEEVKFDEPATMESGRVVGRVDGARYVAELPDVDRLLVGHKTLDKPKSVIFGAAIITVFTVFFASIGLN